MGLRGYRLAWYRHGSGWVARAELPDTDKSTKLRTYRFAHVNIRPWSVKDIPNKVFADVSYTNQTHWCDSIDDAKLWVEAVFALTD